MLPAKRKGGTLPSANAAALAAVDAIAGDMLVQDIVAGGEVEKVEQQKPAASRRKRQKFLPVFRRTPLQASRPINRVPTKQMRTCMLL